MPLTDYNKEKAYKETYDLLLLTYRKVKNVAPDVMKRADCIQDELDTLMETKKE